VAIPIIASYVMAKCKPRKPKRLFKRREEMLDVLKREAAKGKKKHEGKTSRLGHK